MAVKSMFVGNVEFTVPDVFDLIERNGQLIEDNHRLREDVKRLEERSCKCKESIEEILMPPELCPHGE
jgi:hypothetical protein